MTLAHVHDRRWWKEAVVYQIYPRSFNDTTGSGNGDLPGITAKIDYLDELGVDVVWLSPVYDSPMNDNGYDIRNYRAVDDRFGTMADFEALLAGLHERDMRLMMDLVVNHTSSTHRWFQRARTSVHNPYRDYYHWQSPAAEGGPPTDWPSCFGGSAWTYDETAEAYYLHLFDDTQPDLNWRHPAVRTAVYDTMRFWLDKGVDGFRMDVIPFLSKPSVETSFEAADENVFAFYAGGPRIHDYLQEMHRRVLAEYDLMTVGEGQGIRPDEAQHYAGRDRQELQSFFYFDHVDLTRADDDWNRPVDWTLPDLKAAITTWDRAFGAAAWPSVFLGNHDLPRAVSAYGDDRPAHRRRSAKMLATLLLTLRGTPYLYQGDEIGMTNAPFDTLDDFVDVNTRADVRRKIAAGADREEVLQQHRRIGRDNARTPMQWEASAHGGFTDGTPWLAVNPNCETINVTAAREEPNSVYHYYRRLIALRHRHNGLIYGTYDLLMPDHPTIYAYRRTLDNDALLVSLNFAAEDVAYRPSNKGPIEAGTRLVGNYSEADAVDEVCRLRPYEARVDDLQV